jgi:S-methylmethionine-dependent homocysteine/selenocysteine methylase
VITVLDGPIGTELERRGIATPAPGWSAYAIENAPEILAAIHKDYAAAGATVHTANTFRTKRRQFPETWERLAREAVAIAKTSVPKEHRVAASIAPLEDCWRPDLSPPQGVARKEHREVARVLADAGADILLCETFPHRGEAVIAVEEAVRTGKETWVALTAGPEGTLMTAREMNEAARACIDAGASVILVNCSPPERTLAFLDALDAPTKGAYANAGSTSVDEYVQHAMAWIAHGASVVGSCCGTGPGHILEITRKILSGRSATGRT